jgi:hypothetical protein
LNQGFCSVNVGAEFSRPSARKEGMSIESLRASSVLREAFIALVYLVAAQFVSSAFLTQWGESLGERLPEVLEFEGDRPFVYRVLTPLCLNAALAITPRERLEPWLDKRLHEETQERNVDAALSRYRFPNELSVELLVLETFLFLVCVALAYSLRAILRALDLPGWLVALGPVLFLLLLPLHFAGGGYVYDLPEVLFAGLATLFFLQKRWYAYYPVLVLATLNKESSLVLAGFCAAFLMARDFRALRLHGFLHALFLAVPFLATRLYFQGHPGQHAVVYLGENLRYLASLQPYTERARFVSALLPLPRSLNVALLAIGGGLLLSGFRNKPLTLRAMFLGVFALVFPLYLAFGWHDEIRVVGMTFPAGFALCAFTLRDLLQTENPAPAIQPPTET